MSHSPPPEGFIPPHGGYEDLLSFQKARIIFDGTQRFCDRFVNKRSRTHDQMVQAARSGKQNILEGSQASGTSKQTELKLTGVARASLQELLEDYRDFLRSRRAKLWDKDSKEARYVRQLGAQTKSYIRGLPLLHRDSPPGDCGKHHHLPDPPVQLPPRPTNYRVSSAISSKKAACANACTAPGFQPACPIAP